MGIIRKAINSGGMVRSRTVKQETARYTKKSYKLAKAGPQSKPATDAGSSLVWDHWAFTSLSAFSRSRLWPSWLRSSRSASDYQRQRLAVQGPI